MAVTGSLASVTAGAAYPVDPSLRSCASADLEAVMWVNFPDTVTGSVTLQWGVGSGQSEPAAWRDTTDVFSATNTQRVAFPPSIQRPWLRVNCTAYSGSGNITWGFEP